MLTLNCTSCGAEVRFRSQSSVFAVCSFCKATLVRKDMNLEAIGKMADLQFDLTPIQIGTRGKFDGEGFEVIGRLKVTYDEGFWNEWYVIFKGDDVGWLAEAQGFYAVCRPVTKGFEPPSARVIKPGMELELGREGYFEVEDKRDVDCLYSEGELPMNAMRGRRSTSVDLTGPDNRMGTIEYAENEIRVFVGHYQEFDDFDFKHLRRIDGW